MGVGPPRLAPALTGDLAEASLGVAAGAVCPPAVGGQVAGLALALHGLLVAEAVLFVAVRGWDAFVTLWPPPTRVTTETKCKCANGSDGSNFAGSEQLFVVHSHAFSRSGTGSMVTSLSANSCKRN